MAWVTKDSTETYNQTPEPPREYTKKEKAALNFCKNAKITGRRMFTRYALILFHLLNIIKLVLGKEGECA